MFSIYSNGRIENVKNLDKNSLPSSIQAEKAALGCLLLEPNLWDDLATQIEEKDFTQTENKIIALVTLNKINPDG